MKTSNFFRSFFAIASIISLSWPVSVMAQTNDTPSIPEPPADAPVEIGNNWLHQTAWDKNAPEVVYSADMRKQKLDRTSTSVYVITDKDIANHGWRTLAEMLRHIPGVQTMTNESQFQTVSIRSIGGIDTYNSGIVWLQDGVPLNDAHTSGIYLDDTYPVEMIKRIEVVTGPGAAMYGHNAVQGVIHIFTKDAKDIDKYGEYHLTMQNNLTFKASASAAYYNKDKDLGILGHVSGNYTQGAGLIGNHVYNMYVMDQAGANVGESQTPTYYRAENLDSSSQKAWTDVDFKLNYKKFKWDLSFKYHDQGLDGSEYNPFIVVDTPKVSNKDEGIYDTLVSDTKSLKRIQFYTHLNYENAITDHLELRALLSYRLNTFDFASHLKTNTSNSKTNNLWKDNSFQTHQLYAQAHLNWQISDANILTAGISYRLQHLSEHSAKVPTSSSSDTSDTSQKNDNNEVMTIDATSIHTPSIYLMDEHRLWDNRIRFTAGIRYDGYNIGSDNNSHLPSAHVAFNGAFTDWMNMRLAYGFTPKSASQIQTQFYYNHILKEPVDKDLDTENIANALYQKDNNDNLEFSDTKAGDLHTFNPSNPEHHHKVELAFSFKPRDAMFLNFDVYYTHIDNPILMHNLVSSQDFNYGVQDFYIPVNLPNTSTDIVGLNLGFDTAIGKHWNLYAHYSFMYSHYIYPSDIQYNSHDEFKNQVDVFESDKDIFDDQMHTGKLGTTYMNDYLTADLAMFFVGGNAPRKSYFSWRNQNYNNAFYAIFQPQVSVKLPANLGLMVQGSYAFSDGMTESPSYRYYYEKEGVPVNRYSMMFSLIYPFKK